jgi:hypothetical protein
MKTLEALQLLFFKAIFEDNQNNLAFINSDYAAERLAIYRKTIIENMRNALQITFPGVWKLLGTDCADSVAQLFCLNKKHLPSSGCLDDFGDLFPSFLGNLKELSSLPYLEDYATYEWLKHKAYITYEEILPIKPSDLQTIPAEQIDYVSFSFIPSFISFMSKFSIKEIQEILDGTNSSSINLTVSDHYGIIVYVDQQLFTYWLSEELWRFINYLSRGMNLITALENTLEKFANFQLESAIHFLLQNQFISKIKYQEL